MDSRLYRYAFPVNTAADIPSGFLVSVQDRSFETGVFLPQDDSNWFTEPPAYPARLLLLNDRRLSIIPHSSSDELSVEFSLDDLLQLETGNSLLLGWIELKTESATPHLVYNTRASRPVDYFITAVSRRWLGTSLGADTTALVEPRIYGEGPDIKFRNMLRFALDQQEAVLSQYFVAPCEHWHDFLVFRRSEWSPGHLLALTSRNRLLWLNDEYRGRRERYASISISAPLALLRNAEVEESHEGRVLNLKFMHNVCWRVCAGESGTDCDAFLSTINRHCRSVASRACN